MTRSRRSAQLLIASITPRESGRWLCRVSVSSIHSGFDAAVQAENDRFARELQLERRADLRPPGEPAQPAHQLRRQSLAIGDDLEVRLHEQELFEGGAGRWGRARPPGRSGRARSIARLAARSMPLRRRGSSPSGYAAPRRIASRMPDGLGAGAGLVACSRPAARSGAAALVASARRPRRSRTSRLHAGQCAVKWSARSSRATHSDSASVLNQSKKAGRRYAAADSACVPCCERPAAARTSLAGRASRWRSSAAGEIHSRSRIREAAASSRSPPASSSISPTRRARASHNEGESGNGTNESAIGAASTGSRSIRSRSRL